MSEGNSTEGLSISFCILLRKCISQRVLLLNKNDDIKPKKSSFHCLRRVCANSCVFHLGVGTLLHCI